MSILHLSLRPNTVQYLDFPRGHTCCLYVQKGGFCGDGEEGEETEKEVRMGNMIVYKSATTVAGDSSKKSGTSDCTSRAAIRSGRDGLECLVMIGEPLKEDAIMGVKFVSNFVNELDNNIFLSSICLSNPYRALTSQIVKVLTIV